MSDLQRLIDLVDEKLAALPKLNSRSTSAEWRDHGVRLVDVVCDLEEKEGARENGDYGRGYRLTMAGVTATCTSGRHGLLRNWQNAARKRLEKEQGA